MTAESRLFLWQIEQVMGNPLIWLKLFTFYYVEKSFFIEVQLVYSIILVSSVQHRKSIFL